MFNNEIEIEEDYEEYVEVHTACARIIVDLAEEAKSAIKKHSKVMLKFKIEDMLLRTLGMIKYEKCEGTRFDEMLLVICDALDVSVKAANVFANDFFSGDIQELVDQLVDDRYEEVETMIDDLISHKKAVNEKLNCYGVHVYDR